MVQVFFYCCSCQLYGPSVLLLLRSTLWSKCSSTVAPVSSMVQVFFYCCSCQLYGPSVLLLLLLSALWSKCSSTVAPVSSMVQVFFYCCSCQLCVVHEGDYSWNPLQDLLHSPLEQSWGRRDAKSRPVHPPFHLSVLWAEVVSNPRCLSVIPTLHFSLLH